MQPLTNYKTNLVHQIVESRDIDKLRKRVQFKFGKSIKNIFIKVISQYPISNKEEVKRVIKNGLEGLYQETCAVHFDNERYHTQHLNCSESLHLTEEEKSRLCYQTSEIKALILGNVEQSGTYLN